MVRFRLVDGCLTEQPRLAPGLQQHSFAMISALSAFSLFLNVTHDLACMVDRCYSPCPIETTAVRQRGDIRLHRLILLAKRLENHLGKKMVCARHAYGSVVT